MCKVPRYRKSQTLVVPRQKIANHPLSTYSPIYAAKNKIRKSSR